MGWVGAGSPPRTARGSGPARLLATSAGTVPSGVPKAAHQCRADHAPVACYEIFHLNFKAPWFVTHYASFLVFVRDFGT